MFGALVFRIDPRHPGRSVVIPVRIDCCQDEFGTEGRMEDSVLAVRKQFETVTDEDRRFAVLTPLGLAQCQYANTDPLIAAGRMGSSVLRKVERVIFYGIDIDPRQIYVQASPCSHHADSNRGGESRCSLHCT